MFLKLSVWATHYLVSNNSSVIDHGKCPLYSFKIYMYILLLFSLNKERGGALFLKRFLYGSENETEHQRIFFV